MDSSLSASRLGVGLAEKMFGLREPHKYLNEKVVAKVKGRQDTHPRYPYLFWPHPSSWDIEPETPEWDELLCLYNERQTLHSEAARDEWNERWEEKQKDWKNVKPLQEGIDESHWEGVKFLGQGTYGTAALYVRVDEDGNIKEASGDSNWEPEIFNTNGRPANGC
jgi:hypothetical protein